MSANDDDLREILPAQSRRMDNTPFWFDMGIYKLEYFTLFEFGLIEVTPAYPGKQVTIVHLHIGYFHLDFGFILQKQAGKEA
jgi:hypothetical protein